MNPAPIEATSAPQDSVRYDAVSLMELAKDPSTPADHFLSKARLHPQQLFWREPFHPFLSQNHAKRRARPAVLFPVHKDVCICGTAFVDDSKYCRKCWSSRGLSMIIDDDNSDEDDDNDVEESDDDDDDDDDDNFGFDYYNVAGSRSGGATSPFNEIGVDLPLDIFDEVAPESPANEIGAISGADPTPAAPVATISSTTASRGWGWRRSGSAFHPGLRSEEGVGPMHYFLARCRDLRGDVILALHVLESTLLKTGTSLHRTPVHHMLAYRKAHHRASSSSSSSSPASASAVAFPDDVLIAIHACHPGAFTDMDTLDHTPLDRYFRHNKGVMDVSRDPLVDALCRACDAWGLEALVKSRAGYRKPHLMSRELRRFRVLLEGNPFQLETFVKNIMHLPVAGGEMEASLKFMFVVMPLRAPTKYGLSSSQGLNFFTKILTTVVDIYAEEKDQKLKKIWMRAFAEAALSLINDENLLSGMFLDSPSVSSVEALVSTEFLSTLLRYKFNAGPILVFGLETVLFTLLFAIIAYQILIPVPTLLPVCMSCLFTLYFTMREVHQMHSGRHEELKSCQAEKDKAHFLAHQPQTQQQQQQQHLPELHQPSSTASSSSPSSPDAAEAKPHWCEMCVTALWKQMQMVNEKNMSYCLTAYLMMPVAWRSDPFNWIDLLTLISCWITQAGLLRHGIDVQREQYADDDSNDEPIRLYEGEYSVRVMCIAFLSLKLFGFLRGISMKMATFILMLQEISVNVDSFIVVYFLMLLMFTLMYHVLLRDESEDWVHFDQSLWQVWTYALGEFDDVGYQTNPAHVLFSFFMLALVIIMMNILIAIVSDTYDDAMRRSPQIYWRARVLLIAELEPLLPRLHEDEFEALMDKKTREEFKTKQAEAMLHIPNTWQYYCLMFQEGLVATALVCGIVFFELFYVSQLSDDGEPSLRFYAGLGVTLFFLLEILLRGYCWWHTFHSWTRTAIGGFFTNPFRCIDSLLVFIDVVLLVTMLIVHDDSNGGSSSAKAAVKLARVVRLARSARWLRGIKMLRSCRFVAKLANKWRRSQRPTKEAIMASLERSFKSLEERNAWAGRATDVSSRVKDEMQRSTSHVIHSFGDMQQELQSAHEKSAKALTEHLKAVTRRIDDLSTEMLTLKTEMHQTHRKVLGRLGMG